MKQNVNIPLEIKSMKGAFFLPIGLFLVIIIPVLLAENFQPYQLQFFEFLFIPAACWWPIFLFYEYYEEGNRDLLFTYPVPSIYHGLQRVSVFFVLYLILLLILIIVIFIKLKEASFIALLIPYATEAVFFAGLGFSLTTLTKNIILPFIFIGFYVSGEYFAKSQLPWYHAMYFNTTVPTLNDVLIKSLSNLVIGIILFYSGQYFLNRKQT